MKQKKRTKAIAIVLALIMVFTFMPFMGTQKAYAVENQGTITIDLTNGAQAYKGADAAVLYLLIHSAIDKGIIKAHGVAGSANMYKFFLDVNNDDVDDMELYAEVYDNVAKTLRLQVVEGCSQSGEYGFAMDSTTAHYYLEMPYYNDYGIDHFYDTVLIEFPKIPKVEILDPNTRIIYLADGIEKCSYNGADAAAMYTLLMDEKTRLNGNGRTIRRDVQPYPEHGYTAVLFYLDEDNDEDVYATFSFDEKGVCNHADFQLLEEYDDYDTILVNLPQDRLNYYGSLTIPNEYGLEFVFTNLMFNAQKPIDGAEVELSQTAFNYNGEIQKPEVVKVAGKEMRYGTDYVIDWSDEYSMNPGAYTMKVYGRGHYRGTAEATYKINKLAQTVTVAKTSYTKTFGNAAFALGAKTNGDGALKYSTNNAKVATVNNAGNVTIKGTGTAKITVYAAEGTNYTKSAGKTVTVTVNKANNPMAIAGKTATVKFKQLKKKNQTLAVGKVITFNKMGQGALTYTKASGNKKITIAKNGTVTVKKKLKKGTYKIGVKVNAAGNSNYKALTKTVTFTVQVKK